MNNFLLKSGSVLGASLLGLIILINFSAGIVSGVWLAISGNWANIFYGLLLSIVMPFAYTVVALPTMAIMPLMLKVIEKKIKSATFVLGFINILYSNGIMIVWTYFVFTEFSKNASGLMAVPLILWGYSTVVAPLAYMARNEPPDSTGTSLGIFLAQVAYILATVFWMIGLSASFILWGMILLALAFTLFSISIVMKTFDEEQKVMTYQEEPPKVIDAEIEELFKDDETEVAVKFCNSCGKEIIPGSNFCKFCGKKLN